MQGGWTFRTGMLDPDLMPNLEIELDVYDQGLAAASPIGSVRLPVNRSNLMDPFRPFRSLWAPVNESGEIHILTRWIPNNKALLSFDKPSARAYFQAQLDAFDPMLVEEPIYHTV